MKEFKIEGILAVNNILLQNNYDKYLKAIGRKEFGSFLGVYAHLAPTPSILTIYENNIVYSFRKKAYIFDINNVKIGINKTNKLKNLFFSQWEITITDPTLKQNNQKGSFSFRTGTISYYNGARMFTYNKACTLAFAEFLKNWINFLKNPPEDFINFTIMTFEKNKKGKYRQKPYAGMWGQENLIITDDELHIINDRYKVIQKKDVLKIDDFEIKMLLNQTNTTKITTSGGKEFIIGRYSRGNTDDAETQILKNALEKWAKD